MDSLKEKFEKEIIATTSYLFNDDRQISTDPTFHASGGAKKWQDNLIELRDLFLKFEEQRSGEEDIKKYECIYTVDGEGHKFKTMADTFGIARQRMDDQTPTGSIIEVLEWREDDAIKFSKFN